MEVINSAALSACTGKWSNRSVHKVLYVADTELRLMTHFSFSPFLPCFFAGFYFGRFCLILENSAVVSAVQWQWERFTSLVLVIITPLDTSTYVPIQLPLEQESLMTI